MIVQNSSREGEGRTDLSFTVPKADLAQAAVLVEQLAQTVGAAGHAVDDGIAKVSLVGAGMKSNPSVVADMFEALAAERINIEMISTSTIRISCVVRAEDADRRSGPSMRSSTWATTRPERARDMSDPRGGGGRDRRRRSEMTRILEERAFPLDELRLYATERRAGSRVSFAAGTSRSAAGDRWFDGVTSLWCRAVLPRRQLCPLRPRPERSASTTRRRSGWIPLCRW
jgi:hypothetical protein